MQDMIEHARPAAELLKKQEKVLLVSHIDADGISAAGIASTVLDRLGITHETLFIKSIEPEAVKLISSKKSFTWFSDLGSGSMSLLKGINGIITDHHIPEKCEVAVADRGNILSYCKPVSGDLIQVNPHLCGHDGTSEISGAGTTFALALAVDERNKDLAALGIVGAVGDMQDQEKRRLVGLNQDILSIGQAEGVVVSEIDIRLFGRESRGLPKLLMFADPQIPGLTNESKAISFLSKTGVRLQNSRGWWRTWVELEKDEKEDILEAIREHFVEMGREEDADKILGEVYCLPREKPGSGFYDAKEFSTMLNSCGRYDRADIGLLLAKGNREDALKQAKELRRGHRKNLVESMNMVEELGVKEEETIYWFNAGNMIRDTVIGTVAGMYLKTIGGKKPILAFAEGDGDNVKVSIRGTQELVERGMDLSQVMKDACLVVGGDGGGHSIAAGATIKKGKEMEFLRAVEDSLKRQM